MDLCNISDIKALLTRHGFHFSKAKGQNFLTQSWVPREIVLDAGIDDTCGVLEVGPGIGPLTQQLCRNAKKVVAVEVDRSLQPVLAETMAGNENLEIIFGDILKTDIRALVQAEFQGENLSLRLLPGISSGGYTRMLTDSGEMTQFYQYLESISFGVSIGADGAVSAQP